MFRPSKTWTSQQVLCSYLSAMWIAGAILPFLGLLKTSVASYTREKERKPNSSYNKGKGINATKHAIPIHSYPAMLNLTVTYHSF